MHMCTKCLNHAAWKPTPATGSQDCRCPLPSVIKPKASNWNHSILLLRQHSAVQRREPIINPQDDPALKSFPSRPDQRPPSATYFWIHVCLPVAAGKNRMTQGLKQECSLNIQLKKKIHCVIAIAKENDSFPKVVIWEGANLPWLAR